MKFTKVALDTIPATQRASNYSGLHDMIQAMPFYTGDPSKVEGVVVDCDNTKEENNARNSVRGFGKSHKAEFTLKTEKLGKNADGTERFGFLVKKFVASPVADSAKPAKEKKVAVDSPSTDIPA